MFKFNAHSDNRVAGPNVTISVGATSLCIRVLQLQLLLLREINLTCSFNCSILPELVTVGFLVLF